MRKIALGGLMLASSLTSMAQSFEKMQWFNEPEQWKIENNSLSMNVTPKPTIGASLTMGLPWMTLRSSIPCVEVSLK